MHWLSTLPDSVVGQLLLGSSWLYYGLLAVHAIGMAGVVGGSIMLGLRVLGFARGAPVAGLERLRAIALWSFVANAASGVLIYTTNAGQLTVLWTFQLKMLSIVIGSILLWFLWREISPNRDDPYYSFGSRAKFLAGLTIFFWLAAIVSGRYIAYTLPVA